MIYDLVIIGQEKSNMSYCYETNLFSGNWAIMKFQTSNFLLTKILRVIKNNSRLIHHFIHLHNRAYLSCFPTVYFNELNWQKYWPRTDLIRLMIIHVVFIPCCKARVQVQGLSQISKRPGRGAWSYNCNVTHPPLNFCEWNNIDISIPPPYQTKLHDSKSNHRREWEGVGGGRKK